MPCCVLARKILRGACQHTETFQNIEQLLSNSTFIHHNEQRVLLIVSYAYFCGFGAILSQSLGDGTEAPFSVY